MSTLTERNAHDDTASQVQLRALTTRQPLNRRRPTPLTMWNVTPIQQPDRPTEWPRDHRTERLVERWIATWVHARGLETSTVDGWPLVHVRSRTRETELICIDP